MQDLLSFHPACSLLDGLFPFDWVPTHLMLAGRLARPVPQAFLTQSIVGKTLMYDHRKFCTQFF